MDYAIHVENVSDGNSTKNHSCFYNEHTCDFISFLRNIPMAKDFCHICSDRKRKCYQINDTLEYAMLKMNPKCPSCGRTLME